MILWCRAAIIFLIFVKREKQATMGDWDYWVYIVIMHKRRKDNDTANWQWKWNIKLGM